MKKLLIILLIISCGHCLAQTAGESDYYIHYTRDTLTGEVYNKQERFIELTSIVMDGQYIVKQENNPVYYSIIGKRKFTHHSRDKFNTYKCRNDFTMEICYITFIEYREGYKAVQFTFEHAVEIYQLRERNLAIL